MQVYQVPTQIIVCQLLIQNACLGLHLNPCSCRLNWLLNESQTVDPIQLQCFALSYHQLVSKCIPLSSQIAGNPSLRTIPIRNFHKFSPELPTTAHELDSRVLLSQFGEVIIVLFSIYQLKYLKHCHGGCCIESQRN